MNSSADAGGLGPTVLTRAFAEVGRVTLSRLVRVDLRRLVARASALAEEHAESPALARASGLVRWVSLFARNLEMTLYWGAAWGVAHLLMVIVASLLSAHGAVPPRVEIAVDLFLGLLFGVAVLRLAVTTARVRQLSALARPDPGQPRLVNPPKRPPLLRLLEPTDLDLALALGLVLLAEFLA